jgi:SRSO17 transposase
MVHDGPTSAADTLQAGKLGHLRDFTSPDLSSIHPASTHLVFRTKIEMAIDQIRHAATGLPRGIVLADAAYGGARSFRDALRDLDLAYALGVESNTTAVPAAGAAGHATARARSAKVQAGAVRVDALAGAWGPRDWRTVTWREGSAGQLVRGAPGSGRSDPAP